MQANVSLFWVVTDNSLTLGHLSSVVPSPPGGPLKQDLRQPPRHLWLTVLGKCASFTTRNLGSASQSRRSHHVFHFATRVTNHFCTFSRFLSLESTTGLLGLPRSRRHVLSSPSGLVEASFPRSRWEKEVVFWTLLISNLFSLVLRFTRCFDHIFGSAAETDTRVVPCWHTVSSVVCLLPDPLKAFSLGSCLQSL